LKCLRFYGKSKTRISAGRVQSVAVRLIVEREKEIREFVPKASFKLDGIFLNKAEQEIAAKLKKTSKKKLKQKNSWNRQKLQNSKF
jgi:DNA topoisomerase-1